MCEKGGEGRVHVCAVVSSRRQFKSRWWWLRVHLHAPGGPDWDLQWAPQETPCLGNNRSQGVFFFPYSSGHSLTLCDAKVHFHLSEVKGLPYIFKERAAAYIMLRLHGLRLQFSPMLCKNKILQVNLMFYPTYPFTTLLLHANRKMLSFHFIIMTACTITTRTFSVIFTVIYLFLLVWVQRFMLSFVLSFIYYNIICLSCRCLVKGSHRWEKDDDSMMRAAWLLFQVRNN